MLEVLLFSLLIASIADKSKRVVVIVTESTDPISCTMFVCIFFGFCFFN